MKAMSRFVLLVAGTSGLVSVLCLLLAAGEPTSYPSGLVDEVRALQEKLGCVQEQLKVSVIDLQTSVETLKGNLKNKDEFPVGTIVALVSRDGKIPEGWRICNGEDGTPDMNGRFLLGTTQSDEVANLMGTLSCEVRLPDYSLKMGKHSALRTDDHATGIITHDSKNKDLVTTIVEPHGDANKVTVTLPNPPSIKVRFIIKVAQPR